jgi:hypothetical protein
LADSSQSDYDWAVAYGKGEGRGTLPVDSHTSTQHKGTVEEAQDRDSAVINKALDRADSGVPQPDSVFRKQ